MPDAGVIGRKGPAKSKLSRCYVLVPEINMEMGEINLAQLFAAWPS